MDAEQIRRVQITFEKIAPIRTSLGMLFYRRLFELDPTLRQLFTGDIAAQSRKLMTMLEFVVDNLGQFDTVLPHAQALGQAHVGYGVQDAHYKVVGDALLWAIQAALEDELSEDDARAWMEAYTLLATTMRTAHREETSEI